MICARGTQSVSSPSIRWPTTSKGLKLSGPSLLRTQLSGTPPNMACRVAGVRARRARTPSSVKGMVIRSRAGDGTGDGGRAAGSGRGGRPLLDLVQGQVSQIHRVCLVVAHHRGLDLWILCDRFAGRDDDADPFLAQGILL